MEWLQNMFAKAQISWSSTMAFGSIPHKVNFLHAFTAKIELSTMWIIDLGASDHMTGHINLLSSFQPCDRNWAVKIADGSLSRVVGTCSIALSKDITLKSFLLVPNWIVISCQSVNLLLILIVLLSSQKKCLNFSIGLQRR